MAAHNGHAQDEHWIGTCGACDWRETAETFEHLLKLARAHEAQEPSPTGRHLVMIALRPRRPPP